MTSPQLPTTGRIVHYVLQGGSHRAATVVSHSAGATACNLTVHLDGWNDLQHERSSTAAYGGDLVQPGYCKPELIPDGQGAAALVPGELSVASAAQDETGHAVGSWHWPERV